MKKIIPILLPVVMIASLLLVFGCSDSTTPVSPENPKETQSATTETPKVIKMKLQNLAAASMPQYQTGGIILADMVKKATGGRIEVTPYAAGQLVPSADIGKALKQGSIDMGFVGGAYFSDIPEGQLENGFPMMTLNGGNDFANLWFNLGWQDLLRESYKKAGYFLIGDVCAGSVSFWTTKPIETLADLKGLKIRHYGLNLKLLEAIGAAPQFIPHSETFSAMQTGVIDGAGTASAIFMTDKHYEVAKYFVTKPYLMNPCTNNWVMSLDAWNELPEDIQEQLLLVAKTLSWEALQRDAIDMHTMIAKFPSLGVTNVQFSDAETATIIAESVKIVEEQRAISDTADAMIDIWINYMTQKGFIK